jgi:hypothetical protein
MVLSKFPIVDYQVILLPRTMNDPRYDSKVKISLLLEPLPQAPHVYIVNVLLRTMVVTTISGQY